MCFPSPAPASPLKALCCWSPVELPSRPPARCPPRVVRRQVSQSFSPVMTVTMRWKFLSNDRVEQEPMASREALPCATVARTNCLRPSAARGPPSGPRSSESAHGSDWGKIIPPRFHCFPLVFGRFRCKKWILQIILNFHN